MIIKNFNEQDIIRDEKIKYVHMTSLPPLLFDLSEDPEEFNNRSKDPNFKNIASWNFFFFNSN